MEPEPESPKPVELLQDKLAEYLKANPYSSLGEISEPKECLAVTKPWGDDSVAFDLSGDDSELIDALNNIVLPPRYSAIWHRDTREFEVVWTAFKLPPRIADLASRSFVFQFRSKEYHCAFGPASPRLMALAKCVLPVRTSSTDHRNLFSYNIYIQSDDRQQELPLPGRGTPLSFVIRGINWDEDEDQFTDLVAAMNFYMTYFDTIAPRILVHEQRLDSSINPSPRFRDDEFPAIINAREIDRHSYYFWEASLGGDAARSFLYNFQIIEAAAFYYIDESVKRSLRKVLASPSAASNIEHTLRRITDAFVDNRMQDTQKMEALLRNAVDPAVIWREIEVNLGAFCAKTRFDGDYEVLPILKVGCKQEDFIQSWIPMFSNTIRGIRNALSHGREQRQLRVIAPTRHNSQLLQPWIGPMAAVAREVMIYGDVQ